MQVYFKKSVKYAGEIIPPRRIINVAPADEKEILKLGGIKVNFTAEIVKK